MFDFKRLKFEISVFSPSMNAKSIRPSKFDEILTCFGLRGQSKTLHKLVSLEIEPPNVFTIYDLLLFDSF